MAISSYRLYCTRCADDTVIASGETRRDTHWSVKSLVDHKGLCPQCNESVSVEELDDVEETEEMIDLRSLDGIGEKAATNLENKGYDTVEAISKATDDQLTDVSWVGKEALKSLKERAMELDPQKRWE